MYSAQQSEEVEVIESDSPSHTELSAIERDCCKQNFIFYDKEKKGSVERFELPNVLSSKYEKYHSLCVLTLLFCSLRLQYKWYKNRISKCFLRWETSRESRSTNAAQCSYLPKGTGAVERIRNRSGWIPWRFCCAWWKSELRRKCLERDIDSYHQNGVWTHYWHGGVSENHRRLIGWN